MNAEFSIEEINRAMVQPQIRLPNDAIAGHVHRIMVYEGGEPKLRTNLPFFADGYPGIMFQSTETGLFVSPQNKQLPVFFLYGQTIHPIELSMQGPFRLIAFQLYPDSVGNLLDINPKELNDGCFDLTMLKKGNPYTVIADIKESVRISKQIRIISNFLESLSKKISSPGGNKIREAIQLILRSHGNSSVKEVRQRLFITERTFERQFTSQVGIGPKQFAKIIRFQHSLLEITDQQLDKLTDVVYNNGFADQSHFIKSIKEYTGKTPKQFREK